MKPATLKALKGSIRKWERIVDGTGADQGQTNCALCQRFDRDELMDGFGCVRDDGEKCPVYLATGKEGCENTPYTDWVEAADDSTTWVLRARDDESVMCAVLELEFLRDLLPRKS